MTDAAIMTIAHAAVLETWRRFMDPEQAHSLAHGFVLRTVANDNRLGSFDDVLRQIAEIVAENAPETDIALRIAALAVRET